MTIERNMSLSERARQYIKTLKRDDQFISSEEETRDYLTSQGIAPFDQFLKYQAAYSGYELTINNDPGNSFSFRLFSKKQIQRNEDVDLIKAGDRLVLNCGDHRTAQFNFFLTDRGELCTLNDDDSPNVLYSSFDLFVEEYALRNQISHWDCNPYYFEVLKPADLTELMGQKFKVIEECSDSLTNWWKDDQVVAVKGVWLDQPKFYFHVYGTQRQLCDELIEYLKKQGILKK
jgi:hypothetical protein